MALLNSKFTSNPANFLYVFADYNKFIQYLDKNTQVIIVTKRTYQEKVICNFIGINKIADDQSKYNTALAELSAAFENLYGMTPQKALIALASGETVAGKNWAAGVYGVGATSANKQNTFAQDQSITVDPTTGAIKKAGEVVSSSATAIIGTNKKHNNIIGYTYTDANGNCYTSQYRNGKYYCGTRTDANGTKTDALNQVVTNADVNSIWSSIISGLTDFIANILEKLTDKLTDGQTLLTDVEVTPSQTDGFETEESGSNILPWLIAGGAAVAIAAPQIKKALKK